MKLFLYSGFSDKNLLDGSLLSATNRLTQKSLAIFLSNSDNFKEGKQYVYPITEYFSKLGFRQISVCLYSRTRDDATNTAKENPDIQFIDIDQALNSDAIFLSGGNTYYFLDSLRRNNLLKKLKTFVDTNHILIGMSAGSMLMQKDISNADVPSYDPEPNPIGTIDLTSLGLVNFYFFPHFDGNQRFLDEVKAFAKQQNCICYVCKDNDGVLVDDTKIIAKGNTIKIDSKN